MMKEPLFALANNHANIAVRILPTCGSPVGLGANRVRVLFFFINMQYLSYHLEISTCLYVDLTGLGDLNQSLPTYRCLDE